MLSSPALRSKPVSWNGDKYDVHARSARTKFHAGSAERAIRPAAAGARAVRLRCIAACSVWSSRSSLPHRVSARYALAQPAGPPRLLGRSQGPAFGKGCVFQVHRPELYAITSKCLAAASDAQPFHRGDAFRPTASRRPSCQTLGGSNAGTSPASKRRAIAVCQSPLVWRRSPSSRPSTTFTALSASPGVSCPSRFAGGQRTVVVLLQVSCSRPAHQASGPLASCAVPDCRLRPSSQKHSQSGFPASGREAYCFREPGRHNASQGSSR